MIASMLTLSRGDCQILKIKDVYSLHKIVYSLFPENEQSNETENRNFLFADKGGDFFKRQILILSKEKPSKPEYGQIQIKEVDEKFLHYENYGFEVLVNPVKRNNQTRKIIPVRGKDNLIKWFMEKSKYYGFSVLPESLSVNDTNVIQFKRLKKGKEEKITLGKARFVGKLNVTDRDAFIETFENGMGKGKSFGFGLLQLVPLK